VWLRGGYDTEMAWRAKVAEAEARVAVAEQQSKETNTVIEQKIVEKTKVIKGKTEYITQYLDREVVKKEEIIKYIEQCPVPKEIIDIHNQAADMNKAAEGKK
jgi:L-cysteine desulfidase